MFLPLHDRNPIRHIRFAYVTYGLMAVTALVFLYQTLLPQADFEVLTIQYGMIPIVVRDLVDAPGTVLPEWANLVTYAFLHADWLHLLSNMLFLWIFGDNVEDAFGHVKFLLFYLACAVIGALAHLGLNPDANGPLIGASGAVSGVLGAYLMLYPHARVIVLMRIVIPFPLPIPALWMLGVWIATQLFYVLVGSEEPVAWWAHLGGVAGGAVLALFLRRPGVALFGGA